jgi:hypothetical protein
MKTLQKPNEQLAGNLELFLTPIANIKSIAGSEITVTDENQILELICMRESIGHMVTGVKSKAGTTYLHKITALTYGRSDENDTLLDEFMIYKLLAIVRDSLGNYYYVGNESIGLAMEWEYDSGTDASAAKRYTLVIQGKLLSYTSPLIAVLDLDGNTVIEVIAPVGMPD